MNPTSRRFALSAFAMAGATTVTLALPVSANAKPQAFWLGRGGEPGCTTVQNCGGNAHVATWGSPTPNTFDATRPQYRSLASMKVGSRTLSYAEFSALATQTNPNSAPTPQKWLCGNVSRTQGQYYNATAYTIGATNLPLLVSDPSDCLCAKPGSSLRLPNPTPVPQPRVR